MGSVDQLDYDPRNVEVVKQFEKVYGSMVYYVIEGKGTLILLSVNKDSDKWECERLEGGRIMAYVYCFEFPNQSEFGDVLLATLNGALVRVG